MRFSDVQEKEVIEIVSGRFVGFIVDAEVDQQTGHITVFHIRPPKRFYALFQREEDVTKILTSNIVTIGKDVILVKYENVTQNT